MNVQNPPRSTSCVPAQGHSTSNADEHIPAYIDAILRVNTEGHNAMAEVRRSFVAQRVRFAGAFAEVRRGIR